MKLFKEKTEELMVLPEPMLKRINISEIKLAPYQRELKLAKVKQIVKTFIPDIADYPLISFRRGNFYCVDGQHIIRALQEMGYKDVICRVLTGLTYEEECLRFVILNTGRTKLNANQIFHGKVEEKDPNAIALVNMFEKYGFSYNKNGSGRRENTIGTVSSFMHIQHTYGMGMVEHILGIIRTTWFGDADSLLAAMINGLKTFLYENKDCDNGILIKGLERFTPSDILEDAEDYKKRKRTRHARAGHTCSHVAKVIEQIYEDELNHPKRGRKAKAV